MIRRSRQRPVALNANAKEFHVTYANPSHSYIYAHHNNTSMMSGVVAPSYGGIDHVRSFKTREFYFLKQGIFEHRLFSKYIVKCRKERHFLDFGKKKRDDLLEEQFLQSGMADSASKKAMMGYGGGKSKAYAY